MTDGASHHQTPPAPRKLEDEGGMKPPIPIPSLKQEKKEGFLYFTPFIKKSCLQALNITVSLFGKKIYLGMREE